MKSDIRSDLSSDRRRSQTAPAVALLFFRHGRQRGFKLSDPAQSRGELLFKGGKPIHATTDPEKSTRRHGIQPGTKTSRAEWQIGLTPKLTITPTAGVLGSYI